MMLLGNKPFENTVGKGEIALQAIPPFPIEFSTGLDNFFPFSSNLKLSSANSFSLEESKICRLVMTLRERPFENTVGKGENAGNQHSLPTPTMFPCLFQIFSLSSANTFNFTRIQNFVVW